MAENKTLAERHTEEVFKGRIALDVRDSVPDWEPYSPPILVTTNLTNIHLSLLSHNNTSSSTHIK